jgi:hypothetical protein
MRFVGFVFIAVLIAAAPSRVSEVGHVRDKALDEASGLVMSRKCPGVYWTHNDGNDGVLYAIAADGSERGKTKIDAKFRDWEDIAADADGNLYLADVGNNQRERQRLTVYRIAEPDPAKTRKADVDVVWRLSYPERPFNCESLLVHGGFGYVISKEPPGRRAGVYRFPLTLDRRDHVLESVCELPIDEPVTAADLSDDGRALAVLSQHALHLFRIDGDVKKAAAEGAESQKIPIPPLQLEGCCFNPAGVLLIAESGEIEQVEFAREEPAPAMKPTTMTITTTTKRAD